MTAKKHLLSALISLVLTLTFLSAFALPASASIKPNYSAYQYGDAYKTSIYYEQLLDAKSKLTGDHRYDVIMIALSQIGYHEGDCDADMDGWNLGGTNNYVEYNRLFCKLEGIWGYAWCAAFASWCQFQAGIPAEIDCSEVSCPRMINEILKPQDLYRTRESGYTPLPGDLIYFKSASSTAISTHVGIVIGVRDGYVFTVEGNGGEVVARHKYALDDSYIVGYGALKYETKEGTDYSVFSLEDDAAEPGKFFVTADSLNVRKGPGTSYSILGTLSKNDEVEVIKFNENWGRIEFGGKEGWISASYLRSADKNVFTVYYNVGDAKFPIELQRKHPGTDLTLYEEAPKREGFVFGGWASEKKGAVVYNIGDKYTADADVTLYAIWEPLMLTVTFLDYDGSVLATESYAYGTRVYAPEGLTPTRENDGENAYEFAGWDTDLTKYIKRDMTYTATYNSRPLTEEEKEAALTVNATEEITEPAENGCGAVMLSPVFIIILAVGFVFTRRRANENLPKAE